MDPDQYLAVIERLQFAITILIAAVLVAIAYILTTPTPEHRPVSKVVEHCKLHARPVSECRDQHKLDG